MCSVCENQLTFSCILKGNNQFIVLLMKICSEQCRFKLSHAFLLLSEGIRVILKISHHHLYAQHGELNHVSCKMTIILLKFVQINVDLDKFQTSLISKDIRIMLKLLIIFFLCSVCWIEPCFLNSDRWELQKSMI